MKKIIGAFFCALIFTACSANKHAYTKVGKYKGVVGSLALPPSEMILWLNSDSTFNQKWKAIEYTGRWKSLNKTHVLLKYDEITDFIIFVMSGVILDEEVILEFTNKNRIETNSYTLKRGE